MYASDWCFALFANIVPSNAMHLFLDSFFKDGWAFFYRFTLTFLKVMSSRILMVDEISEILDYIKQPMNERNFEDNQVTNQMPEEPASLLSSIGKFFRREQPDSLKEVLGMTYEQFVGDETTSWIKIIELANTLYPSVTEKEI
jgi:hypothetical protein